MCVSDLRLGRLIRAVPSNRALAVSSSIVCAGSQQRVGISFGLAAGTVYTGGDLTLIIDGLDIFTPSLSIALMHFTVDKHGELPMKNIGIRNSSALTAYTIGVIEYFLPQDVLESYISQFKAKG